VFPLSERMVNVFLDPAPFLSHSRTMLPPVGKNAAPPGLFAKSRTGRFPYSRGSCPAAEFAWAASDANVAAASADSPPPRKRQAMKASHRMSRPWSATMWRNGAESRRHWIRRRPETLSPPGVTTALASYQVDKKLVMDFRKEGGSERDLINLTAWAATSAKRIASWL